MKNILFTVSLCLLSYLIFYIGIEKFFYIVFDEKYKLAPQIAKLLAVGTILIGIGDFFNKFLQAKGQGNIIRNCTIITGVISLIVAIITIFKIGVWAAVISRIISNIAYCILMIFSYLKFIKSVGEDTNDIKIKEKSLFGSN